MQNLNEIESRNDVRIIKKIKCELGGKLKFEKSQLIIMEFKKKQEDIECVSGYVLFICNLDYNKSVGDSKEYEYIDLSKIDFVRKDNDNLIIIGTKNNEQYIIKPNSLEETINIITLYVMTAKDRLMEHRAKVRSRKYGTIRQEDKNISYWWWLEDEALCLLEERAQWGVLDELPIKKINYVDIIYCKEVFENQIILKTKMETYEFYDFFSNFNEFISEKIDNVQGNVKEEIDGIRKYKVLLDEGIITEEDFEKKKKKIMGI